ncbi:MAG: tetratricopeptide repeat protein [Gammaproteobacteria bacterium]
MSGFRLLAGFLLFTVTSGTLAQGRAVEDVRISKQGSVATVEFRFPCAVRYLSHSPQETGVRFRIRLALEEGCQMEIGRGIRSELYQPPGRELAEIHEVTFDKRTGDDAELTVSFYRAVEVDINQGISRNEIRLTSDTGLPRLTQSPRTEPSLPNLPPPASVPQDGTGLAERATESTPANPNRQPMRIVQPSDNPEEQFVLQLATDFDGDLLDLDLTISEAEKITYVKDVRVGTRTWRELRLGFFESEEEAQLVLNDLVGDFPNAIVAIADVDERSRATPVVVDAPAEDTDEPTATTPDSDSVAEEVSEERSAELMAEARTALVTEDYSRAIQIYTRLLEDPSFSERAQAREFLGLARERNGQIAHARAEYEAYIAEYPAGPDALRVRQRLAGLANPVSEAPTQVLRASTQADQGWDFSGGVSQYYRRDVMRLRDDERGFEGQSGLQSRVDLLSQRKGERFDLYSRINAGYYYDFRSDSRDPEDQGLVSNAYLEVQDRSRDVSVTVGRQSMYRSGVLGRFDGAHAEYQWRPDIAFNVTTGFPVDSPRYVADTGHQFYALSADLDDLVGSWDFSFFGTLRRIDGIADREAVGAEARYRNDRWNLIGIADVDLSYEVLNSALFVANWRATDRITLNGRANVRAAPFLTTRNALIGQPVETIDDLLQTYSEPQIRRLARNRTAQAQELSVGASMPFFQRFQLNADFFYTETDATVSSGGVAMTPATGPQYTYSVNVMGSSLFRSSDTAVFGFRHLESREALVTTLSMDVRLPYGSRLRVNPRVAVSYRKGQLDRSEQWVVSPMMRLIYRWGQRHRVEAELGGEWSNRDLPSIDPLLPVTEQDSAANFVNIGYWMEF